MDVKPFSELAIGETFHLGNDPSVVYRKDSSTKVSSCAGGDALTLLDGAMLCGVRTECKGCGKFSAPSE